MTDNYPLPPPPPSSSPPIYTQGRPFLCRQTSWHRPSPTNATGAIPPPPPPDDWIPDDDSIGPESLRSCRSSLRLDEDPAEPRSGMDHIPPEMWDEIQKLLGAGGIEGLKKRIVEEGEPFTFAPFYAAAFDSHAVTLLRHIHSRD